MQDMKNMWEVVHRLIDGETMTDAEKSVAHGLTDTHLAQHLGIARAQGEHRELLRDPATGKLGNPHLKAAGQSAEDAAKPAS